MVSSRRSTCSHAALPSPPRSRRALKYMRVLVTGGAGFIGGNVAISFAERHPDWEVTALDNLRRRGAELNVPRLREAGIRFVHGDIRVLDDLGSAGPIDALVECSAEPSA